MYSLQADTSTSDREHCCNLGCLNVFCTFEHSLHVKIIVNDLTELTCKQAVDLLFTVINLRYKEQLLQEAKHILVYNLLYILSYRNVFD
jgi:hypothetical protein